MRIKKYFFIMVMLLVVPSKHAYADINEAYDNAKETEHSFENRMLGGVSTAATGIGAMQVASAFAEQRADEVAERDMSAYITTMKCEYGGGHQVNLGQEETLPGGNELLGYYNEYREIAERLKETKNALGLRPGIESEVLYDRAQSGLYQYASIGKTGGGETSLYRALTDETGADAVAWAEQKEKSAKQLKTGASVVGAGVATGIIGNAIINKNDNNKTNAQTTKWGKTNKKGVDCSNTLRSQTHVKSAKYDENGNCVLVCKYKYEKTADNLQCVPTEEQELATANREYRRNTRNEILSEGVITTVNTGVQGAGDTANILGAAAMSIVDPAAGATAVQAIGEVSAAKYSK